MKDLKKLKQQYSQQGIDINSVNPDPVSQFAVWYSQAGDSGIAEPNGFSLCSVSEDAGPSQRTVLMKHFDENGFIFYTNHNSRKAREISLNNRVSMLFPWYELYRQVSIEGGVEKIDDRRSSEYFSSRPAASRISAWASRQSEEIKDRTVLEKQVGEIEKKFSGREIPLPPFWGGYLIRPDRFEFWQGRAHRLHDRIVYTKAEGRWILSRLSP